MRVIDRVLNDISNKEEMKKKIPIAIECAMVHMDGMCLFIGSLVNGETLVQSLIICMFFMCGF